MLLWAELATALSFVAAVGVYNNYSVYCNLYTFVIVLFMFYYCMKHSDWRHTQCPIFGSVNV